MPDESDIGPVYWSETLAPPSVYTDDQVRLALMVAQWLDRGKFHLLVSPAVSD